MNIDTAITQLNDFFKALPDQYKSLKISAEKNYALDTTVVRIQGKHCGTVETLKPDMLMTVSITSLLSVSILPALDQVLKKDKLIESGFDNDEDVKKIEAMKRWAEARRDDVFMTFNSIHDKDFVIAGGAFTSHYHNEKFKDVDIFILNNNQFYSQMHNVAFAAEKGRFTQRDKTYLTNNRDLLEVINDNHTGFQYIFTKYNTREELLEHFDFEHCRVSYYMGKLYMSKLTFDCIKNKVLMPHKDNRIAQWRVDKFVNQRGFTNASKVTPLKVIKVTPLGTFSNIPYSSTAAQVLNREFIGSL